MVVIIILNIVLLPIYGCGFLLAAICASLPIFPTRVAHQNFKNKFRCSFLIAWLHTIFLYLNYFFTACEYLVFLPLGVVKAKNTSDYNEFLASYCKENGMLFISAHVSNIEAAAVFTGKGLEKINKYVVSLAKPSSSRLLTKLIFSFRKHLNVRTILNNKKNLFQEMSSQLKSGHGLALILDQKPTRGGVFVPFFGEPAAFPFHGINILLRFQPAIAFVCLRRFIPGYFFIEFKLFDKMIKNKDGVIGLLQDYSYWLEAVIRKSPHQWCWDYKKWSRKPPEPVVSLKNEEI